jgi:putative addiction module component (TIGR02574 family)
MNPVDELFARAQELPEAERADLAHRLLSTLEADATDPDYEEAWAAELAARLAKVERGEFTARPWREAVEDLRRSLPRGQSS